MYQRVSISINRPMWQTVTLRAALAQRRQLKIGAQNNKVVFMVVKLLELLLTYT